MLARFILMTIIQTKISFRFTFHNVDRFKKVPNTPGVYKFFNNHEIIYIGKAKDLKKRVSSYFGKSFKDRKTNQIRFLTNKVETFTTKNEVEALLLEQMLIKENKPKFNILLRDDKNLSLYISLLIMIFQVST